MPRLDCHGLLLAETFNKVIRLEDPNYRSGSSSEDAIEIPDDEDEVVPESTSLSSSSRPDSAAGTESSYQPAPVRVLRRRPRLGRIHPSSVVHSSQDSQSKSNKSRRCTCSSSPYPLSNSDRCGEGH